MQPAVSLSIGQKQRLFARLLGGLLEHIYEQGYECTLGEAYRTPEQAALNAQKGIGISNSVHTLRLAIDINLFKDGKLMEDSIAHKPFGDWWVAQNPLCRWGGDFSKPDGNHYSLFHNGVS